MVFFINNDSDSESETKTEYYESNSLIFTWQGICSTNNHKEYIITGTQISGQGAIYKGPINNIEHIDTVTFPDSTSTSVYGPEYENNCFFNDSVTVVGSYQTGSVGITEPCNGFGYKGKYGDFNNPDNYFTIEPIDNYIYTVVHSTRAGLAVYISSNESQLNFIIGKSFIFDIDKKETITEVLYPDSLFTTTYGIWYNGRINCYDSYTISGGFTTNNSLIDSRIFVVDFLYDRKTNTKLFINWTEIKLPEITLFTHAQGITGLNDNTYILPIANFYLDPNNDNKLIEIDGAKIKIKREHNHFITVDYEQIKYPNSILSIITSAAENSVVGVAITDNNEIISFQAETKYI